MTGHTAQLLSLKKYITSIQLFQYNWKLSHMRNIVLVILFYLIFNSSQINKGFRISAIGHIIYILVRAVPVYRLGSCYVGDRTIWQNMSDFQRLLTLLKGNHPFMTIEVGSLSLLGLYLFYLRFIS